MTDYQALDDVSTLNQLITTAHVNSEQQINYAQPPIITNYDQFQRSLMNQTKTSPIPIQGANKTFPSCCSTSYSNSPVYHSSELLVPISALSVNNLNLTNQNNVYKNSYNNKNSIVNKNKTNNPFYDNSKNDKYDLFFDNSTLDPFHDMELNAINDKEELKNILEQSSLLTSNAVYNNNSYFTQIQPSVVSHQTLNNSADNIDFKKTNFYDSNLNS